MVGILSSNVVLIGVVAGIPALAVLLVVLWALPSKRALAGGATVVAVALAGVAVWAVFRPSGQPAVASAMPPPPPTESSAPAPPPPTSGTCQPSGTQVHEAAKGIAFTESCLAAPADQAFTIDFDNQDAGIPHNIQIFQSDANADPSAPSLFNGDLVTGPASATYEVGPLPAGSYFFRCDVHPTQMHGTFVVA